MKSTKSKLFRRIFTWFILPIILFYTATWIFKPQDKLLARLSDQLKEQAGIELKYTKAAITPFGTIILHNLTLDQMEDHQTTINGQKFIFPKRRYFTGDKLNISISWRQLLKKNAGLKIIGTAYSGQIDAVFWAPIQKEVAPQNLQGTWSGIDLEKLAVDFPKLQVKKGICHGTVDFLIDQTQMFKYKGPATITVENAAIIPPEKLNSSIDLPVINQVTGDVEFNFAEVRLHDVWLYGTDVAAQVTGLIYMKLPTKDTWLNLDTKLYFSGKDTLNPDNYTPITIEGPAKDPSVLFLGMDLRKLKF